MIKIIFMVFGIFFLSLFIHEGFHIIESEEPVSVCYDFGKDSIAHVNAKGFKTDGEFFAYYFQTMFVLGCLLYLIKKNGE